MQSGIGFSEWYAQCDACIRSGLDWAKWKAGKYDENTMAELLVYWQRRSLIETHQADAVSQAHQQQSKRK